MEKLKKLHTARAELIKTKTAMVEKLAALTEAVKQLPSVDDALEKFGFGDGEDPCATEQSLYNAASMMSDALHNVAVAAAELSAAASIADAAGDAVEAASLEVLTNCRAQNP